MIQNIKIFFILTPIVMTSLLGSDDLDKGSTQTAAATVTHVATEEEKRQLALRRYAVACFHNERRVNAIKLFPNHPYHKVRRLLNGYVLKNERAAHLLQLTQAIRALAAMKVEAIKLHKAVRDNHIPTALSLIKNGTNVNAVLRCSDASGCPITIKGMEPNPTLSPLMVAAIKSPTLMVRLLDAGANPFLTSGIGRPALAYAMNEFAASEDQLLDHYFSALLARGYTEKKARARLRQLVNQKSDSGTPVIRYGKDQIAIKIGHLKRYGVNLSATDANGVDIFCRLLWLAKTASTHYEPRHLAHNTAYLKEALDMVMKDPEYRPQDVNVLLEGGTYSPLIIALELGYFDVAAYLITKGHRPDVGRDRNRNTALMLCLQANKTTLAQSLFDLGADPTLENRYGRTAIDMLDNYSSLAPNLKLRYMVMKWKEDNNCSLPVIPDGVVGERWAALIQGKGGDPIVLKNILIAEGGYSEAKAIRIIWNVVNGEMDMTQHVGGDGSSVSGSIASLSSGVAARRQYVAGSSVSGLISTPSSGGVLVRRQIGIVGDENPGGYIDPIDQAALDRHGGVGVDDEDEDQMMINSTEFGSVNESQRRVRFLSIEEEAVFRSGQTIG